MSNLDYEVYCYRVVRLDPLRNTWFSVDYPTEESALSFMKDCIKLKNQCKMFKFLMVVGDL